MSSLTIRDVAIAACAASSLVHVWLCAEHFADDRLLSISFGVAAVALALAGFALARPSLGAAPLVAAGLFASLLVAYPVVHLVTDERVDALGIATKLIEAAGLAASLGARRRHESFASLDALVGVFVGAMLLSSLGHGH